MIMKLFAQLIGFIALIVSTSLFAQTQVPNEFQSGQPARAAEVNENFSTLESAIDQNAATIQQIPAGPQGDVGPQGPPGAQGIVLLSSVTNGAGNGSSRSLLRQ